LVTGKGEKREREGRKKERVGKKARLDVSRRSEKKAAGAQLIELTANSDSPSPSIKVRGDEQRGGEGSGFAKVSSLSSVSSLDCSRNFFSDPPYSAIIYAFGTT